ncbi:MAG: PfkB family carbohydrate kinase [Vicinamibacterales bacterium]|nr:PfkB family carbohydrate kinase [Vicinamibacterales bacterium]
MTTSSKIRDIHELAAALPELRAGRVVVHCHGVFDLLHIGHIRHFNEARKAGDLLIVSITPDRFVNKGPHRPVFTEALRAEAIASLGCVDYVTVNQWPNAVEAIQLIKPDKYAKGSDYRDAAADHTGGITLERQAVEAAGGTLIFTDDITFSSSSLLNRHLPVFSADVNQYLAEFRERYPAADVVDYLNRARQLRVLVVGEAIIDEYQYCETLGKSGKEPILAAQYVRGETYIGGSLAIANHAASCAADVTVLTLIGTEDSHEDLIRAKLSPNVHPELIEMPGAPTLVKRRFVETYPFQKLFEVYVMDETAAEARSADVCAALERLVPEFDVVVVADYGHGMLDAEAVRVLGERSRFLAVNVQVNAGNHGFNTISKFRRADFVSLSEKEIRLEARNPSGDLRRIVKSVADELRCGNVLITRGAKGCLCYGADTGFFEVPGFAIKTVDRVGAGDAVFAVASLCAALGAPAEVLGLLGNAVGTQAVGIVGNERFIERAPLVKHIEALLK